MTKSHYSVVIYFKKNTRIFKETVEKKGAESSLHSQRDKRLFCRQILELLNYTQAYYLYPQGYKAPELH